MAIQCIINAGLLSGLEYTPIKAFNHRKVWFSTATDAWLKGAKRDVCSQQDYRALANAAYESTREHTRAHCYSLIVFLSQGMTGADTSLQQGWVKGSIAGERKRGYQYSITNNMMKPPSVTLSNLKEKDINLTNLAANILSVTKTTQLLLST